MAQTNRTGFFGFIRNLFGINTRDDYETDSIDHSGGDRGNPDSVIKVTETGSTQDSLNKKDNKPVIINTRIEMEKLFHEGRKRYLGLDCEPDIPMAIELFQKSADIGSDKASYTMYKILYQDKDSRESAIHHLKNAVDLHYIPAMYDYSIHLLYGDDMQQNVPQAVQLLEKCADLGCRDAAEKLYYIFTVGFKVRADKERAAKYRHKFNRDCYEDDKY